MRRKDTTMMRVPIKFKDEVHRIARKREQTAVGLLNSSGVTLFQNADFLTDAFFGGGGRKKKRR